MSGQSRHPAEGRRLPDGYAPPMQETPSTEVPPKDDAPTASDVKRLGPAGVLGLLWLFLPPLGSIVLYAYLNTVGTWLRGHESEGIVLYIVCFAVLAGLGVMPTYASAILGGWAFGFLHGFPAALCGFLGASMIGYAVARAASQDRVTRLIKEKPRWEAVREALVGGTWGKTLLIITLLRLPPNSPFALTNLVLSSVRVPLTAYALGTLIGMAPRTGLVLYIASTLRDQVVSEAVDAKKPWWLIAAGIGLSLVVLGVIGLIAKHALDRVTKQGRGGGAGQGQG